MALNDLFNLTRLINVLETLKGENLEEDGMPFGDPNVKSIFDDHDFGSSPATDQASDSKSKLLTKILYCADRENMEW